MPGGVDPIIPRAVVPELDNAIANLELMPMRANAKAGSRLVRRAEELHRAGLLSKEALATVRSS